MISFNQAERLYKEGKFDRAQNLFQSNLDKVEGSGSLIEIEAREGIAKCFCSKRAFERALIEFSKALEVAKALKGDEVNRVRSSFRLSVGLTRAYLEKIKNEDETEREADIRKAQEGANEALRLAKGNKAHSDYHLFVSEANELKGDVLLTMFENNNNNEEENKEKLEEALACFLESVDNLSEVKASSCSLIKKCGDLMIKLGRSLEAVDFYENQIESGFLDATGKAFIHHEAGCALVSERKFKRAEIHLKMASELLDASDSDYENVISDLDAAKEGKKVKSEYKSYIIESNKAKEEGNAEKEAINLKKALECANVIRELSDAIETQFKRCEELLISFKDIQNLYELYTDWGETLTRSKKFNECVLVYERQWMLTERNSMTLIDKAICLYNLANAQDDSGEGSKEEIMGKFERALKMAKEAKDIEFAIEICSSAADYLNSKHLHKESDEWKKKESNLELTIRENSAKETHSYSSNEEAYSLSEEQRLNLPPIPIVIDHSHITTSTTHNVTTAATTSSLSSPTSDSEEHNELESSENHISPKRPRQQTIESPQEDEQVEENERKIKRKNALEELSRKAHENEEKKKESKRIRDSDLDENGQLIPCLRSDFVDQDLPLSDKDDIKVLENEDDTKHNQNQQQNDIATLAVMRGRTGKAWRQKRRTPEELAVIHKLAFISNSTGTKKQEPPIIIPQAPKVIAPIIQQQNQPPIIANSFPMLDRSVVIDVVLGILKMKLVASSNMTISELAKKALHQYEDSTGTKIVIEYDIVLDGAILSHSDKVGDLLKPNDKVTLQPRIITASTPGVNSTIRNLATQKTVLTILNLENNRIDDKSFAALCNELPSFTNIQELNLSSTGITRIRISQLAVSLLKITTINKLLLSKNPIGHMAMNDELDFIISLFKIPSLSKLDLSSTSLKANFLQQFKKGVQFQSSIKLLDLSSNLFGSSSFSDLLYALSNLPILEELSIEQIGLSFPFEIIGDNNNVNHFPITLQSLFIGSNPLKDEGAKLISSTLQQNNSVVSLKRIDAHSSLIGGIGCKAFLSSGAKFLNLSGNDSAGIAMVSGIREGFAPGKLTAICISRCGLGIPGLAALLRSIPSCPSLCAISAEENSNTPNTLSTGQLKSAASSNHLIFGQLLFIDLSKCGISHEESLALIEIWRSTHQPTTSYYKTTIIQDTSVLVFGDRSILQQHKIKVN